MTGMKSGAGSDPFAGAENEESGAAHQTDENGHTAASSTSEAVGTTEETNHIDTDTDASQTSDGSFDQGLPYLFARDGVKDERSMIQYFLRETTKHRETKIKAVVENELGTDVYLTDLREAIVQTGMNHPDEVAEQLRECGYRFRG